MNDQARPLQSTPDPAADPSRYAAFISYRHVEPDRKWAKWLHTKLETYRVPAKLVQQRNIASRVGRIFRDEEELPASADLNQEIEAALQESRFLIVVCSPRTPQSQWVNKEILRFREMGRHDRILALLIEGEPGEAFPPALREIRRRIVDEAGLDAERIEEVEPLAADVRPSRSDGRARLARMAKLRLLACVLRCRFDDLRQREQERRTRQFAFLGALAGMLLCVMTALTIFAFVQRRAAINNAGRATRGEAAATNNAREAQSARAQATHSLARSQIELAEAARTKGDLTDTLFYYWRALGDMDTSDQWHESTRGLLASWMRRAGRPFLYDWRPRTGVSRDPDVFPMEDRFQSRLFPVAFSPGGAEVLTVSQDRTVRIWKGSTGRLLRETGVHDSPIRDIVVSSGGGAFAVECGDNTIWTWQLPSAKLIGKLRHDEGGINAIACSSDGTKVLLGCNNNYARLWDVHSNEPCTPKLSHDLAVHAVAITSDDHLLITSGAGVKAWDVHGGPLWAAENVGEVIHAGLNSKVLLAFGERPPNQLVRQIDAATGNNLDPPRIDARLGEEVYNGDCWCLGASPDGLHIACGGFDRAANRGYVMVWNALTGEPLGAPLPHAGLVHRIEFAPDGKSLISATVGGDVRWWDLSAGTPLSQTVRQKTQSSSPILSPNGKFFLIGTEGQSAKLCDVLSGNADGKEIIPKSRSQPLACASDGKMAVLGDGGPNATLWDVTTGQPIGNPLDHSSRISSARFSRNDSILATASEDGTIQVWDGRTGARRGTAMSVGSSVKSLDVSSASNVLIVGCANGEIEFWNYESSRLLSKGAKHSGKVNAVALSGDGRLAVSGGEDRTARIWDSSANEIGEPLTHDAEVLSVALGADGRLALTGTENGAAWLWDVPTRKVRGELLRHWERPPSRTPIVVVSLLDNERAITGEAFGVFRVWEICRMGPASSTELQNRVELLSGWRIGPDGVRLRLTPDQWQEHIGSGGS